MTEGDHCNLQHCTFVLEFGYLAAFSNAGGSKLSDVSNDAKIFKSRRKILYMYFCRQFIAASNSKRIFQTRLTADKVIAKSLTPRF